MWLQTRLRNRSMMVCMERVQHLDGKQACVLNEQILQLFPQESYCVMHQGTTGLYTPVLQREERDAMTSPTEAGRSVAGLPIPARFLEKSYVSFTKSCTAWSLCIFSLQDCHVTLCGLLLALQKASCSLRLSANWLSINRV